MYELQTKAPSRKCEIRRVDLSRLNTKFEEVDYSKPWKVDRFALEQVEKDVSLIDTYTPEVYEDDYNHGLLAGISLMIGFCKGKTKIDDVTQDLKRYLDKASEIARKEYEWDNTELIEFQKVYN